ncbi:MAG: tRNA-queuosine alpha-mannosyltransferase domain-containing protein, partial [Candidatus Brocadiia bacterium]
MRILFIEPYFGGSHRAFAEGYRRHSAHEVELLTMPPRKWRWRMQGGAMYLADRLPDNPPDMLLVSDFLDLATLKGLRTRYLCEVPSLAYFHENQLNYPVRNDRPDEEAGLRNITTALAADHVAFNSRYNRDSFLESTRQLLGRAPDCVPSEVATRIRARSDVIPVGVDLSRIDSLRSPDSSTDNPLRLLWNHRWEYDKNPETFFEVVERMEATGLEYQLNVVGENRGEVPAAFERARDRFGHRIRAFGTVPEREDYLKVLLESDVVVSTAIHEFFGVAVVEAMYAGCAPLLPDRLSYPELIPEHVREVCLYRDADEMFRQLRRWSLNPSGARAIDLREQMSRFRWERVAPELDELVGAVVG